MMSFEGAKAYLLTSNGIYLTNPLGEKPPDAISVPLSWDSEGQFSDVLKWQESESRTSQSWIALIQTENK